MLPQVMAIQRKVCPVVIRRIQGRIEILAFRHPIAGYQLVKGTIEAAETMQAAAERELLEESGVVGTAVGYLGLAQMTDPEQEWHFVACEVGPLPDSWTHRTSDGGGLDFEFFWHPMTEELGEGWHPIFKQALGFIGQHVKA